ncbi:MAG: hypothetical protein ACTSVE_00205 [Candidatus Helarchaeota archaeon]
MNRHENFNSSKLRVQRYSGAGMGLELMGMIFSFFSRIKESTYFLRILQASLP